MIRGTLNAPSKNLSLASLAGIGLLVVGVLSGVLLRTAPMFADTGTGSISLTTVGSPVSENFNSLANTGTTNTTLPTGWYITEQGGGARDNEQYGADNGASTTGDTYSYGATGSTERALGALRSGTLIPFYGAKFTNNTGVAVTSLGVSYNGEEWRLGAAARTDRIDFQYSLNATDLTNGTYTDVDQLDFTTPNTVTAGAKDGNAAGNRTSISFTISGLSIANGASFFIRWTDLDPAGSDDGLAVDDFSLTPNPVGQPTLSINDVTVFEGDAGATIASFTVSLSVPAQAGGVTFDIGTQDNSATTADSDYVGRSLTGQTIPQGNQSYTFDVTVNGDTTIEPNETLFVNVTNVVGAVVSDGQGLGTINNDDVVLTRIDQIQGSGTISPVAGMVVSTRGIVTGVRSNGFYIQEHDATIDTDLNTSEGIFVFTSSAPPAIAAVSNLVQVTGTVQEFVPPQDPLSPPTTEFAVSPTVILVSTGNSLPAPITLTPADTGTGGVNVGSIENLERYEGMRVRVGSLTVVAPTEGNLNESTATSSSNGVFYGVITGVARPFREPGIQANDPAPVGSGVTIPPVPRFDFNPEKLRVDSDALIGAVALNVTSGAVVSNLVGPLDYAFRTYTILADPPAISPIPVASGNISAIPVPVAGGDEFTIASFNMERFFDTVNDPGVDDVALTATAFNNRLNKASLAIRNVMRAPDVIGIVEMENLTTLQAVANKVNSDAVAAGQPDPMYQPYLEEGNDIGGIDVGFLVKKSIVFGSTPRVTVNAVVQEGKTATYIDPNTGLPALLNDRPSLRLMAVINHPDGRSFPLTVIVNHLRSLSGVDDPADGNRVRTKRRAQAEFLANLIQTRQMGDPTERIVSIGDYNAFQFNDGYGDSIGTIKGTPAPPNEVVLASSDLVNPDLTELIEMVSDDQRYSFSFDGNAQALDHELITGNLLTAFSHLEYARNNSDFPEVFRNDPNRPERISDHDMPVAYFTFGCAITCPANVSQANDVGQCGAVVSYPAPTTSASCFQVSCTPASGSFFPTGTTTVTCSESISGGTSCSFTVTVNDTEAPIITGASANPSVLWPPNHALVPVTVNYTTSDNCGSVTCTLSVTSNEPINGTDDGDTSPDWIIIDAHHVQLRAERSGVGSGRIYTITITCTDGPGNSSSRTVTVTVPLHR